MRRMEIGWKWVAVIFAGLWVAMLGCGGPSDHTADGRLIVNVVVTRPNNQAAWDEALKRFHAAHPDLHINLISRTNDATQYRTTLTNQMRAGDRELDVFMMDVIWPAEFAAKGWALPLDDKFGASARQEFFAGCMDSVTVDGKVYGVPLFTDSGMLYYRKDLLEKYGFAPPKTWPDMLQQIATITGGESNPELYGYSGQFKKYEGLVCNMLEFIESNGGDMLKPNAPATLDAVTFVRQQIIGQAAPEGVLADQEEGSLVRFKNGHAIFHRNWPYAWSVVNDPKESQVVGKVGIARIPAFPAHESTAALGGWSLGIYSKSAHPDAAWKFVEFMTSPEIQKLLAIEVGKAPTRTAVYDDEAVIAANPHFAEMREVFETATPRPKSPVYERISLQLQAFFADAINPSRQIDVAEAAAKTAREIADIQQAAQ